MAIKGMSGYGQAKARTKDAEIFVEIRSVNHRFLDIAFHLPERFLKLEESIRKECEAMIRRGRITLNVVLREQTLKGNVIINHYLAKSYVRKLNELNKKLNIKGKINFDTLINLPGVLNFRPEPALREEIWPKLRPLIQSALNQLVKMRIAEGRLIYKEIISALNIIEYNLKLLKKRFLKFIKSKRRSIPYDEFAVLLKDRDIQEEVSRLGFFIKSFRSRISLKNSVIFGKELDFISQELLRETNTIGAKSQDASLTNYVVIIKNQIERIREQLQNVE